MKRAKKTVFAYSIDCPHCGEPIPEPNSGSLTWEASQVGKGDVVTCVNGCQRESQL